MFDRQRPRKWVLSGIAYSRGQSPLAALFGDGLYLKSTPAPFRLTGGMHLSVAFEDIMPAGRVQVAER